MNRAARFANLNETLRYFSNKKKASHLRILSRGTESSDRIMFRSISAMVAAVIDNSVSQHPTTFQCSLFHNGISGNNQSGVLFE